MPFSGFSLKLNRSLAVLALLLTVAGCGSTKERAQVAALPADQAALPDKAIVVVAMDFREETWLRDVSYVGDVFFRKLDENYARRSKNDYDFGIEGSDIADWRSTFGGADTNRAPHIFVIAPGRYVIEKINFGSNASTAGPGFDAADNRVRFGEFTVAAGEVVNLGRLALLQHWWEGYFDARADDDSAEVQDFLAAKHPKLGAAVQTRLLTVVKRFRFTEGKL